MEKIERLLSVMSVLLATERPMSAVEVRRAVPAYPDDDAAYKRAFERDKEELREMGVPLIVERIPDSDPPLLGYRIRPSDYELRDPGLEPDELEALNLAATLIGVSGGAGERALFKLGGGSSTSVPQTELPADPTLTAAFAGVADRRQVTFAYHGVTRVVDPYRLQFVRGRWYLNGFDHTRGEDRWFRLERVEGDLTTGDETGAFERPVEAAPGLALDPWVLGGGADPVVATVWFDPSVAGAVRRQVEPATVERDDGDGLVVTMPVTNRDGFRSWLVSFLDRAEVLGPPELRDLVVTWLSDIAERPPRSKPAKGRRKAT